MRIKFTEKGQSLIEVIIALTIAVIVILALVRVTVTSIHNAGFARNRALATRYAQEWMEEARELRDDQGGAFFTDSFAASPCGASDTVGIFTRTRTCQLTGETMSVVVEAEWADAAGPHKSELETRLTNWRAVGVVSASISGLTYVDFGGGFPGDLTDGVLVQAYSEAILRASANSSGGGNYTLRGLEPNKGYYVVATYLGYWAGGAVTTGDSGTTVTRNFYLF